MGGMVAAVEMGYPLRVIAESAYRFQKPGMIAEDLIAGLPQAFAAAMN